MKPTVASLSEEFEQYKVAVDAKLEKLSASLDALKLALVDSKSAEIKDLQRELNEMKLSMDFMNKTFEAVKAENATLVASNKSQAECSHRLSKKVAQVEQYSRLNNIEIRGVPVTQNENCSEILELIGEKVGCPVTPDDFDTVHRVPTHVKNQLNIIARFRSRDKRSSFLSEARKARLATSSLNFNDREDSPIFINEHLTPENKRLLGKARALKKDKNWMFVWTENCVIKARKTINSRVFRVLTDHDLAIFEE